VGENYIKIRLTTYTDALKYQYEPLFLRNTNLLYAKSIEQPYILQKRDPELALHL
jgi:hypothetical protein